MPVVGIHTHAYTPKWLDIRRATDGEYGDELDTTDHRWLPIWWFVMRYIAPSAIALVSVLTIIDQAS